MADYHFLSTWHIRAPIEQVWDEIYHAERWPDWWPFVVGVEELEPGADDGVGKRLRLLFRTRLPYTLGFDTRVTRVEPPCVLDAVAVGELEGTGRWRLTQADDGTIVTYAWDVRTTQWWMNVLAPVARPAFNWNHGELMRSGGESLAKRLGTTLIGPDAQQESRLPIPVAGLVVAGAAAAAMAALGWRRRTRARSR